MCDNIFTDPVIVTCGHTYCRRCIQICSPGTSCPSRLHERPVPLSLSNALPNLEVAEELGDLSIRCQFGCKDDGSGGHVVDPDGCQEDIRLTDRQKHESNCPFRTVNCPYNAVKCPKMRVSELEAHLKSCTNVPCRHQARGCKFLGTQEALSEHLHDCKYKCPRLPSRKRAKYSSNEVIDNNPGMSW